MQPWQDILATAVVGTDQHELVLTSHGDELGQLIDQIDGTDREGSLLSSASLLAQYRRAGFAPPTDSQVLLDACAPDEAIRGSSASGQHLALMLEGEFKEVLPEWLVAMNSAGKRVPEEYLPALLDKGRAEVSLRELIIAVQGKRGEWLATQNPEWTYATRRDDNDVWETGTRDERLLLLDKLRARDSTRARDLLAATWQQDSAKDRAAFLEKLAVGVNTDDEAFLNEALHDRSAEVRRVARGILARLPHSEFSRRLKDLTTQVLTFRKPLLGKGRVEVSLPDDPVDWLKTNNIEIDGPPRSSATQSIGPKGWCLKEMISLTAITHWVELWQKSPIEIMRAAKESEWAESFAVGFVQAVHRDRDPDWIEALVSLFSIHPNQPSVTELAAYLPVARLEASIMDPLKAESVGLCDGHPAFRFLLVHRSSWSDQLSRAVVNSIKRRINTRKDNIVDWQTRAALKQFAQYISPALYDELASGWPIESETWAAWSKSVDAFQSLLAFRRDMHNAISQKEQHS